MAYLDPGAFDFPWLQSGPAAAPYYQQRPTTTYAPPTGAYTPPPTNYFPDLSGVGQILYSQQPRAAFTHYRQQVAADPNSPLAKYLENLYPDIYQGDYTAANLQQPGLAFTDFLNRRGQGYVGGFSALTPAQRGEHPVQFSRWLGG